MWLVENPVTDYARWRQQRLRFFFSDKNTDFVDSLRIAWCPGVRQPEQLWRRPFVLVVALPICYPATIAVRAPPDTKSRSTSQKISTHFIVFAATNASTTVDPRLFFRPSLAAGNNESNRTENNSSASFESLVQAQRLLLQCLHPSSPLRGKFLH